jgi:peptidoglycan/LPS O-acetylase OafA/YrhL
MPAPQPPLPPQDDPPVFGRFMPALDGLRGIAVLGVMILHFSYWYLDGLQLTRWGRIYIKVTTNGWMGVDLFFVLSGFLITGILLDAKGSPHFFRNFYARRTLRIFPLYYGVIAVVFLVLPLTPVAQAGLEATRSNQAWLWLYGTNLAVYMHGWGFLNPYPLTVTHFWSLAVEEHFYLIWPLVVYLTSRRGLVYGSIVFVMTALVSRYLLLPHSHHDTANLLTPCRTDQLAIGGLLALACRRYSARQIFSVLRPVGIGSVIFLISQRLVHSVLFQNTIATVMELTVVALFSAWLVAEGALMNSRSFFMPLLARSPFVTLGRYSYGIYVFHQLLNKVIYDLVNSRLPHLGPTPATILYSCIAGSISFAAAFVSFHCYEKWFLRLKVLFPAREDPGVKTSGHKMTDGNDPAPAHLLLR